LLGLSPRFDVGPRHFILSLHTGTSLPSFSGAVPARSGGPVLVSWVRSQGGPGVTLTIQLSSPTFILGWPTSPSSWLELTGTQTVLVPNCQ
jgi:hypothetical protein